MKIPNPLCGFALVVAMTTTTVALATAKAITIPSTCAVDGSCHEQIQNAFCDSGTNSTNAGHESNDVVVVHLEAGAIYPLTRSIVIDNECGATGDSTRNATHALEGHGAHVVLENSDYILGFLWIPPEGNTKGLSLRDFSVTTRRPHYTVGTFVGNTDDNRYALVQVNDPDRYPSPCQISSNYPGNIALQDHWLSWTGAITGWDVLHQRPSTNKFDSYQEANVTWLECDDTALLGSALDSIGNTTKPPLLALRNKDGWAPPLPMGENQVLMRHIVYSWNVIEVLDGQQSPVQIEDVWVQSGGGMALVLEGVAGITLKRFRVAPAPGFPMSTSSDAVHISSPRGGDIRVEDCFFSSQGDDGINVKNEYYEMVGWSENKVRLNLSYAGPMRKLKEGDSVSFYSRRTYEKHSFVSRVRYVNTSSFELVLEDDVPSFIEMYDLMVNENGFADSVTIIGSEFRNNRARGALLKTSNVTIINTLFKHTSSAAIQVSPSCVWFCEGHFIRGNWSVEDSTFIGNNFWDNGPAIWIGAEVPKWQDGKPTPYGELLANGTQHSGISIRNNLFHLACNGQVSFIGHGIDGFFYQGNEGCDIFSCHNCRAVNQCPSFPTTNPGTTFATGVPTTETVSTSTLLHPTDSVAGGAVLGVSSSHGPVPLAVGFCLPWILLFLI